MLDYLSQIHVFILQILHHLEGTHRIFYRLFGSQDNLLYMGLLCAKSFLAFHYSIIKIEDLEFQLEYHRHIFHYFKGIRFTLEIFGIYFIHCLSFLSQESPCLLGLIFDTNQVIDSGLNISFGDLDVGHHDINQVIQLIDMDGPNFVVNIVLLIDDVINIIIIFVIFFYMFENLLLRLYLVQHTYFRVRVAANVRFKGGFH